MSNLPVTELVSDVRLESEEAHYTRLVEQYRELEAKVERLEDPDWLTYIELTKQWLAHYPADIFDGSSGAPGPLFVVAIRNALAALEGK